MDHMNIFLFQMFVAIGITLGSLTLHLDDKYKWNLTVSRYIIYIITVQGTKSLSMITYDVLHNKRVLDVQLLKNINGLQVFMYMASIGVLFINEQKLFAEDFPLIFIACLIVEYPEIGKKLKSPDNYGVGMACNFYQGYLLNVIPSDGGRFGGFVQNIHAFESRQGVVVPVKKLFIVITKSLYSPSDLELFNKADRDDLPKLEACTSLDDAMFQSLDDVEKDVAGVRNRSYKNSTYKIYRPHGRPVCLVAECATPLHTLHRVLENRDLYEELADVNVEDVTHDFCSTLNNILAKSSECRDKIELVFYDDLDPESNLADVLLDKIRQLAPNFEDLISVRR